MKKISLSKLRYEWRRLDYTDKEICSHINLDPKTLTKKFNGTLTPSLSATQFAQICEYIEKPMDMFYTPK